MLRRGIAEAIKEFWERIARTTPSPVVDQTATNEALLLSLGRLNEALLLSLGRLNESKRADTELLLHGLKLAEAREKHPIFAMELRALIQTCELLLK
jgi:hypothetical protein